MLRGLYLEKNSLIRLAQKRSYVKWTAYGASGVEYPNSMKRKPEKAGNKEEFHYLDQRLRPSRWEDYIGQENIKENLHILLTAALERNHPPEHVLFYGPPGLGKTTLAHLIAKQINTQIRITSGPAIERVGDLASILTNLSPGDILFIDEVHRLNKAVEEILYPAMESGRLSFFPSTK
ncbi:MAG: holliday junction DNA helicase RuvB [Parcubacteria group bacterium Gr01-1014_107]|nr:MAG: holliday junction DNA helicase RuvB [Parcubacteria group bacterium Gr01-1014_107]